ncbi:non-specific serine/threonine protein kinase [Malassezia cuniculi]|uniref:Serine/threonine-protein kinase RIO1 n=1 Tax=Malassezia cuniculi TaxID=948313 RepID=A0AAF0ENV6_9BASI|nr:non-specific serine/threonine protein kinase [Malassezia cuniculi]
MSEQVSARDAISSDARVDDLESLSSSDSEWSDLDAELGNVEDGDWELARGDFTKQYNRARQLSSALQPKDTPQSATALPAINRVRQAKVAPEETIVSASAAATAAAHASKTEAQISALAKYASRVRIDSAYDPSAVAGGSVDARVPRKTNRLDVVRHKDKADRATLQQVLDPRTMVILYKMINRGLLAMINGCISTGKEANVYHATTPATEDAPAGQAAVKIYKTSILVFKDRDRYVSGEFRFRHGYARHNPRKMVRLWAEKEMRNLRRMVQAGLRSPKPIELRDHVLVMEFLGDDDGWASPRLKDVEEDLSLERWTELYCELLVMVHRMYHECRLVHADLSEYNILYHEGHLWIIDVSQSVEHDHPRAFDFLREDISHVEDYFGKRGVNTLGLRQTFHFVVRDTPSGDDVEAALHRDLDAMLHDQSNAPQGLVSSLLDTALQEDIDHANAHEEAVFRQSFIPRTLEDVYDPERDASIVRAGGVQSLIYAGVTGMDQVGEQPAAEAASRAPDGGDEQKASGAGASEGGNNDEDGDDSDDDDSDADGSSASSSEGAPDPAALRDMRKAHKKEVKAANRERRKTKMPKAEKKRRMKKSTNRKK